MAGNQWQFIVVFLLLVGIVVWICYNLFSKKRRRKMSQCPGCAMHEVCHKPRPRDTKCDKAPGRKCCDE